MVWEGGTGVHLQEACKSHTSQPSRSAVASALLLNTDARGTCSRHGKAGAPNFQLNFTKKNQLHPSTREVWGDHPKHSLWGNSGGFVRPQCVITECCGSQGSYFYLAASREHGGERKKEATVSVTSVEVGWGCASPQGPW